MKKFLSLILALTMIISCVSMVSFVANAEEATTVGVMYTAAQDIPAKTNVYANKTVGHKVTDIVDGFITKSYTVYNPNKYPITVQLYYQDGWTSMSGLATGSVNGQKLDIPARSKKTATIKIAASEDGVVTYQNGAKSTTVDKLALRFDIPSSNAYEIPKGTQFFIEAPAGDAIHSISAGSSYNGSPSFTKQSVTEYPDITTPVMGDGTLEEDTYGWGTIHGGTFSKVADPVDATNSVAKLTASGTYHSIFFDFGPYIINDPELGYNGNGAGYYNISFKYRAESLDGYTGNAKFTPDLNSQNHLNNSQIKEALPGTTYSGNTYVNFGSITMTEEWQTFTYQYNVGADFLNVLKDLRHNSVANTGKQALTYQLGLRLDGGGSAFKDARFNYLIDDVEIEFVGTKLGVKAEITKDYGDGKYPYWRTDTVKVTEDDAVNNVITLAYDIYNIGETEIAPELQFQNGWGSDNCLTNFVTLPTESKTTLSLEIPTDGNGNYVMADGATVICPLSALTFRLNYKAAGSRAAGSAMAVVAKNDISQKILNAMNGLGSNTGGDGDGAVGTAKTSDYIAPALPDYAVVTAPAAPTPVPTPRPVVGLKLTSNTGLTGDTYYLSTTIKADASFSGEKTFTYKIHNVAKQAVSVSMSLQTTHDGKWIASPGSTTTVVIPAESFAIVTSVLTVTNGKALAGGTEYDLSKFFIRINQTYSAGAQEGDGIIVEAAAGDVIYTRGGSGNVSYENVYDLPEYIPYELVNGDVSKGEIGDTTIEGWLAFNNGVNTIVADPDDETNKVVRHDPTKTYSSIGFKAAPIVYNNGVRYFGNGLGLYKVTFRARLVDAIPEGANANQAGAFDVSFATVKSGSYNGEANTFNTASNRILLTDTWATYTVNIPVLEKNYKTWTEVNNDAANIFVRLDASGDSRAFGYTGEFVAVPYLMDDVTIEFLGVPAGFNFEYTSGNKYITSNQSVFTANDVVNNYITSSKTFYNPNSYDISISYNVQAAVSTDAKGSKGWYGYGEEAVIKPGQKVILTAKVPVNPETGKAVITNKNVYGGSEEVEISSLFMRVNLDAIGETPVAAGTKFVIEAPDTDAVGTKFKSWIKGYTAIIPDFKIVGATLDLGSTLTMNYYADLGEGYENATMDFIRNGQKTSSVVGVLETKGDRAGLYKFAYEGINPQCMGDNIEAYLVLDGNVIAVYKNYSVKDYALRTYGTKKDAKLDTLLADMLAYGAASQTHTGYNANKLVNADITWATSTFDPSKLEDVRNVGERKDPNNYIRSAGMNISNVYKLFFRFELAAAKGEYTVKLNNVDVTDKVDGGVLYTDAIKATGNKTPYIVELIIGGEVVSSVEYNVDAYINSMYGSSSVGEIVKAIANYSQAAVAYAN